MRAQSSRFAIGVFVLASILALVILVILFGSVPTILKRQTEYGVRFRDATGIGQKTPVRRSGVRIGEVSSLVLDDDTGEVHVRILIDSQYILRKNEQPTLVVGLLGGDATIDFQPVTKDGEVPDRTPVDPSVELIGVRQANVSSLVSQAATIVPSTQETFNDIRKTLQSFEKMTPNMEEAIKEYRALGKQVQEVMPELRRTNQELQVAVKNWGRLGERADNFLEKNEDRIVKTIDSLNKTIMDIADVFSEENKRNLSGTLKNLNAGTEKLESLTKNTEELIKEGRTTLRKFNETLTHTNEIIVDMQQVTKPLSERGGTIVKNVDESVDKLNKTMADVRELVRAIGQGDGALRRFVNDPALYNNLNDTLFMVQRLMPRVDRILKDMEVFADKLARHPEAIGLGGVVNPSKGLKEVPSSTSHYLMPPGR